MKEKTLELEKIIELIGKIAKYVREKEQKKYNTGSSDINKRKTNKKRADTTNGKIRNKTKNKNFGNRTCRFCNAPKWTPIHKCPASEANCNKCGKNGHYAKAGRQKFNSKQTVKRLTGETEDHVETSSESDESRHHNKEIRTIEEKNEHYTATVKIKGVKKEFITETGSPIKIMPPDEKMMKSTGIQKITNRYQEVIKNKVKIRGKLPVKTEYENKKQKMAILITERTDITSLLGMDWMKTFKLTIGRLQLAKNNQSE